MKKVKITVMRKVRHDDLIDKYENPLEHECDVEEGDVFIANGWQRPEGLCESAWESMSPFVMGLAHGAEDFYDLPVAGGRSDTIAVRPERDIIITGIRHEENEIQTKLIMPHFVYAPQSEGDRAGMIYCFRNGKLIAGAALVYAGSVGINKQETT